VVTEGVEKADVRGGEGIACRVRNGMVAPSVVDVIEKSPVLYKTGLFRLKIRRII